jgi:hypothetical protein
MQQILLHVNNEADFLEAVVASCDDHPSITLVKGDALFCDTAECIVATGDSFGNMGNMGNMGNSKFDGIEERVHRAIDDAAAAGWRGELPVGAAVVVQLQSSNRYLCYAPIIRNLEDANAGINAYLAMRGALVACSAYNRINTIAVPLLCHGGGNNVCNVIRQVQHAWDTFHVFPAFR